MEGNRVELKYYDPVLAKVTCPKKLDRQYVPCKIYETEASSALLDTTLYVKANPYMYNMAIDLNTIDLSKFNSYTGRWRAKRNPSVVTFLELLETDTHPLCFVPMRNMDKEIKVIAYLEKELEKERNNIIKAGKASNNIEYELLIRDKMFISSITKNRQLFNRFQVVKKASEVYSPTPLYKRLVRMLTYFGHDTSISRYGSLPDCEVKYALANEIDISQEYKKEALYKARAVWYTRYVRNYTPPDEIEFEDNSEMLEKVKQHLRLVKGLKITYLRKRMLAHYSSSSFKTSPDAAPKGYYPPFITDKVKSPLLYSGEAWALHFTINDIDYQEDNLIYFCTPEQYVKAMTSMGRPDLVKNWKPWSDLLFISSDWYEDTNLGSPSSRKLSLAAWVLGPFIKGCIKNGRGNPL
jgi:hypothetical protein